MDIDCGRCQMRGAGCQDCVITVLEPRNVAGFSATAPGYLGQAEVKALAVLAAADLNAMDFSVFGRGWGVSVAGGGREAV